jgi:hypothetical protein
MTVTRLTNRRAQMRRLLAAATPLAVALALAGCGAAAAPSAATATPTITPNVQQAAATAYLAEAVKFNDAIAAASTLCPGPTNTAAQLKACYGALYTAEEAHIQAVFAIKFPAGMKADVNQLITTNTQVASASEGLSTSSDPATDDTDLASVNTEQNASTAAAELVRHDLGLPPVPLGTSTPSSSPTATATAAQVVTFSVTGSAPGGIDINYDSLGSNAFTDKGGTSLPWSTTIPANHSVDEYQIQAFPNNIDNINDNIACSIAINGKVIASATDKTGLGCQIGIMHNSSGSGWQSG